MAEFLLKWNVTYAYENAGDLKIHDSVTNITASALKDSKSRILTQDKGKRKAVDVGQSSTDRSTKRMLDGAFKPMEAVRSVPMV